MPLFRGILAGKHLVERVAGRTLVALWMVGEPSKNGSTNPTLLESTANGWWYAAFLLENLNLAEVWRHQLPWGAKEKPRKAFACRGFLKWTRSGSNRRPPHCQCGALPAELRARFFVMPCWVGVTGMLAATSEQER